MEAAAAGFIRSWSSIFGKSRVYQYSLYFSSLREDGCLYAAFHLDLALLAVRSLFGLRLSSELVGK